MTRSPNPPGSPKSRSFSKRFVVLLTLFSQPMSAFAMFMNPSAADQVFAVYVSAMLALAGLYMGVGAWDLKTMLKAGLFNVTQRGKPHD